ncbi:MAG: protein translocase SEC61 complex subunit gamma [Candidatus Aenigmarchaeota archaeon]|nr:protein translocase SEC61 complex subunit gamma [Candidatus Aenigmarchaeota archaeon]MBS3053702.1 protein translocase SEC61 complex subunit gamma [Candidatus Aenigmarchaeota archaeon]
MIGKLKGFITQARRVLLVASKPDKSDYRQSVKITGLGMAIIGALGFIIFLAVQLIGGL